MLKVVHHSPTSFAMFTIDVDRAKEPRSKLPRSKLICALRSVGPASHLLQMSRDILHIDVWCQCSELSFVNPPFRSLTVRLEKHRFHTFARWGPSTDTLKLFVNHVRPLGCLHRHAQATCQPPDVNEIPPQDKFSHCAKPNCLSLRHRLFVKCDFGDNPDRMTSDLHGPVGQFFLQDGVTSFAVPSSRSRPELPDAQHLKIKVTLLLCPIETILQLCIHSCFETVHKKNPPHTYQSLIHVQYPSLPNPSTLDASAQDALSHFHPRPPSATR